MLIRYGYMIHGYVSDIKGIRIRNSISLNSILITLCPSNRATLGCSASNRYRPNYIATWTRSTQRSQTDLAEADHYSHIAHCKNVEPWLWKTTHLLKKKKKKKKSSGSLPSPRSGYATTITVCFAHLLILQYPDHHQNLISSSLYYSGPVHKISSQSVHNFLSNVVHRQTNKQTNQRYQKHNLLCQGGNEPGYTITWRVYSVYHKSFSSPITRTTNISVLNRRGGVGGGGGGGIERAKRKW